MHNNLLATVARNRISILRGSIFSATRFYNPKQGLPLPEMFIFCKKIEEMEKNTLFGRKETQS